MIRDNSNSRTKSEEELEDNNGDVTVFRAFDPATQQYHLCFKQPGQLSPWLPIQNNDCHPFNTDGPSNDPIMIIDLARTIAHPKMIFQPITTTYYA